MTRETKVGLLVGLGIILLIGIIVSDHLSVAQHQNAADLTHFAQQTQQSIAPIQAFGQGSLSEPSAKNHAVPFPRGRGEPGRPTAIRPAKPLPVPADGPPSGPSDRSDTPHRRMVLPAKLDSRLAGGLPRTTVPTLSQTGAASQAAAVVSSAPTEVVGASVRPAPQPVIHYVKSGQSLWQIAQRYYDNGEYWQTIAQANPKAVAANGNVRVGVRLVIPSKTALSTRPDAPRTADRQDTQSARAPSVGSTAAPQTGDSSKRTYTVRENDSLTKIAEQMWGAPDRWEDIYQANRKVLDHPDHLKVGQRITIPRR